MNYPSNMLYAAALDAGARLYGRNDWAARASRIRAAILDQSFDGEFFVDNAVRDPSAKLARTANRTEVCQYYAFFFGLADPKTHPGLWERLLWRFGPLGSRERHHPDVHPANAIIGNYLRLDLLTAYGHHAQALREIKAFFLPMARATGTLWEHMNTSASCNHGFASHVVKWILEIAFGLTGIDEPSRTARVRSTDGPVADATGVVPVATGELRFHRTTQDGTARVRVTVPEGYRQSR